MSRKNRKYGNEWLEKHFDLFCRHEWFSVRAWTHRACGPWWAPQSNKRIEKYEIARFETLEEYKAWFRARAAERNKTRTYFRKHGIEW